jgi:hypothetical protein
MTNADKKTHKREFIKWVIQTNKGKMFTYNSIRKTLGRFEDLRDEMINNGELTVITKSRRYETQYNGELIKIFTKTIYKSSEANIEDNFYVNKLFNLLEKGLLDKKDTAIVQSIKNTISVSTLDGKPIPLTYSKDKGNRYYSDYISIPKEDRKRIKIDNKKTISIDLSASQLQLLAKTNIYGFDNDLVFDIMNSKDIWGDISKKMGLSKDETKKLFIESINGRFIHKNVYDTYPQFFSNLIRYKKEMGYKAVSQLYFKIENSVMSDIMTNLMINKIHFLPVHDCIIVQEEHYSYVTELFNERRLKYKLEY